MDTVIRVIISSLAVYVTANIVPGVAVVGFGSAVIAAILLAVVNAVLKPILVVLTLPITILTLGLFMVVINAGLVMLVSTWVPGFHVDGFWSALFFSIVVSIINTLIYKVFVRNET
jgi:putative membrane protein